MERTYNLYIFYHCTGMSLFCFWVVCVINFSSSQKPQGQCPSHGDPTTLSCCLNYLNIGGECIACQSGTMGINCSRICPDGFYGQFCLKKCNCDPTQRCSKARGCVCKGDNCPSELDLFNESSQVQCKSNEAALIVMGLLIGFLLIFIIPVTVQFYRLKRKRTKRPLHAYMDTDLKMENKTLHSYEAMKRNDLKVTNEDEMEHYIEPKVMTETRDEHYLEPVTSGPQRKNAENKQTGIYNTNYSKLNEADIMSKMPHKFNSVQPKTIKSSSPTKKYEQSYLVMTSKPRQTYLEVIGTDQPKLQSKHITSDYVHADPPSQEELYE
ncbi:multiple epidermal growth factor-like domains protein 10 isoform X2 [Saccostrea cucullata]|uniref:multiple epidermal growth factor-like domains protein 10 isoform X2 n=1 Tax=Saccostrea cuccullata TaxID=36930 RepID=UPI002ED06224